MKHTGATLLLLSGALAAAVFLADHGALAEAPGAATSPQQSGTSGLLLPASTDPQVVAGEARPVRQSPMQDPFGSGRSWFSGNAPGRVLYLDPDSDQFQAAARQVAAENESLAVDPPMQLLQPAPPDAAAAF